MSAMQRSIAARYAVPPVVRFVRPAAQGRTRRMGLRTAGAYSPAPMRRTVLQQADVAPLVHLRASWRAITPARRQRSRSGGIRPSVTIHWARSGGTRADRRSSAAPAPWRG